MDDLAGDFVHQDLVEKPVRDTTENSGFASPEWVTEITTIRFAADRGVSIRSEVEERPSNSFVVEGTWIRDGDSILITIPEGGAGPSFPLPPGENPGTLGDDSVTFHGRTYVRR